MTGGNAEASSGTQSGASQPSQSADNGATDAQNRCQHVVERYKRGKLYRIQANHALSSVLLTHLPNDAESAQSAYQAYQSYLGILDAHDTFIGSSGTHDPNAEDLTREDEQQSKPGNWGRKRSPLRSGSPSRGDDDAKRQQANPEEWPWVAMDKLLNRR